MILKSYEIWFDAQLTKGLQSPFIAHVALSDEENSKLKIAIKSFLSRDAWRFIDLQKQYPKLSVWALCRPLSETYGIGEEGLDASSVWPRISKTYGVQLDDPHLRNKVCDVFRDICDKEFLCYQGKHRNVDDLLTQAGVALGQLVPVARTFLAAERLIGLPDTDNTEAVNAWEDASAEYLSGYPVARRVLLADFQAYHAEVFLNCRAEHDARSIFEDEFYKIIDGQHKERSFEASQPIRPKLIWNEDTLALKMPDKPGVYVLRLSSVSNSGQLKIVGPIRCRKSQTRALPSPWPQNIEWQYREASFPIQVSKNTNEILVFSQDTSEHIGRIVEQVSQDILLSDSKVILVSELPFEVGGYQVNKEMKTYVCYAHISAEGLEIKAFGGILRKLRARPRLRCRFVEAAPLRFQDTRKPLLSRDSKIEIETSQIGVECDVNLKTGYTNKTIQLTFEDDTIDSIRIGDYLPPNEPPSTIKIAVSPKGGNRVSQRISGYVWPALDRVHSDNTLLFHPSRQTEDRSALKDVVQGLSENIIINTQFIALNPATVYRHAILSLRILEEPLLFKWVNTNDLIILTDDDGYEELLEKNSEILLSPSMRNAYLTLICADRSAVIDCCGDQETYPFYKTNQFRIYLESLYKQKTHDRIDVLRGQITETWICIKRVETPKAFTVAQRADRLEITFVFESQVDELALSLTTIKGKELTFGVALSHMPIQHITPTWCQIRNDRAHCNEFTLLIDLNKLDYPLSLVKFSINVRGTKGFKELVSSDSEHYAACIYPPEHTVQSSDFLILQNWINKTYVEESRVQIENLLLKEYNNTCMTILEKRGGWGQLLAAVVVNSDPNKLTQSKKRVSVLATCPNLFSGEAHMFSVFGAERFKAKFNGFQNIFESRNATVKSLFKDNKLCISVLAGYANFIRSEQTGAPLQQFSFKRYCQAANGQVSNSSLQKQWGNDTNFLSALHYQYALKKFIERFSEININYMEEINPHIVTLSKLRTGLRNIGIDAFPWPESIYDEQQDFMQDCVLILAAFAKASRHCLASKFIIQYVCK